MFHMCPIELDPVRLVMVVYTMGPEVLSLVKQHNFFLLGGFL